MTSSNFLYYYQATTIQLFSNTGLPRCYIKKQQNSDGKITVKATICTQKYKY